MYFEPPVTASLARLPTPLQALDRLSNTLAGPRIWIKRDDLTGTLLTGNKIRKLEFVVARALAQGKTTLITCGGVQSNHCRATALVAAQLGLSCHLVLRGEPPSPADGNNLLAELAGANITYLSHSDYTRELTSTLTSLQAQYDAAGRPAYVIPTGASDGVGLWGYYSAARELAHDFSVHGITPQLICCATGSGGTHAGLALGIAHLELDSQVRGYAVCDSRRYFEQKERADIVQWYQIYHPSIKPSIPSLEINDEYIGAGYGHANAEVFAAIKLLARTEGIILDPVYTGKAFAGLLEQIRRGELHSASDVVFVHTGGVYGIFPYRQQLQTPTS